MRPWLNRYIPFDTIVRWWYILVALSAMGLVFSLVTDTHPMAPMQKLITIGEGPDAIRMMSNSPYPHPGWKDDLLFTLLGLLVACGVVWLLEQSRDYRQRMSDH